MPLPPYPLEPVRDRYVTPFGGVSEDLAAGEVGVNARALAANTSLVAGRDHVLVSSDLDPGARPLFARPFFRVVGLSEERPDASGLSPQGEVVFSSEDYGGSRLSLFNALRRGALVVLNATLLTRAPWTDGVFARARFRRPEE